MKNLILVILFISFTTFISIYSIIKADYNWDIIGYIGSVYSLENSDTNSVHQKTYESIKNALTEDNFKRLTTNNKYREDLTICAKCFYQTLPFYKIKPLYILLIYLFHKLNINIVLSPLLISAIFYFLSCIIIYVWLTKIFNNIIFIFFIAGFFNIMPYLLNSASNSTPDSLSGFIVLLALYFLVLKRSLYLFLSLMIISIFTRPDNILFFAILTGILLFNKEFGQKKAKIIILFIIGILINYSYSIPKYRARKNKG